MMLLHLLEAHRQLLRLLGEDGELLDDLLGRHLAAATALHRLTAEFLGLTGGGVKDLTGSLGRREENFGFLTAAAVAARAALAAGKRESITRIPNTRHFLFVLTQDNFYAEHMRQSGVVEGSTVNFCAEATAFVRK